MVCVRLFPKDVSDESETDLPSTFIFLRDERSL